MSTLEANRRHHILREALEHVAIRLPPDVLAQLVLTHPKIADQITHSHSMIWKTLWHNTWKLKQKRKDYKKACTTRLKKLASKKVAQKKNMLEREKILSERKRARKIFDKMPLTPPGATPTAAWSIAYMDWVRAYSKKLPAKK